MYEVTGITSANYSGIVATVGTYTITTPGKYKITLMGENASQSSVYGAGGQIYATTTYSVGNVLTIKRIQGSSARGSYYGGVAIAFWDTVNTTGEPLLVAGGSQGYGSGGAGIKGGYSRESWQGYNWNGGQDRYQSACYSVSCVGGAQGGSWPPYYFGGTGTATCPNGYTCEIIPGGNSISKESSSGSYLANQYGNYYTNPVTGGKGYASITYCGPDASSTCP